MIAVVSMISDIPYKKMLRDGALSGICVVVIFYILTYFIQMFTDFYKPHWTFALGLGIGNMFLPMWNRYKLEKKNQDDEFEHIIEVTEEVDFE